MGSCLLRVGCVTGTTIGSTHVFKHMGLCLLRVDYVTGNLMTDYFAIERNFFRDNQAPAMVLKLQRA
jgi:hypothetical protein